MLEPTVKRTFAFIDGQNLFLQSKEAFGYRFPNYNVGALAREACNLNGWELTESRFYTGIHDAVANPFWNAFWVNKTAQMGQTGIKVITRPLRYRNKSVRLPDGTDYTFLTAEEKGIDVRIALDVIAGARNRLYDVGIIFSQDQDLAEVASEIRTIAHEQGRWIKIACAFPDSPAADNRRGINNTDWLRIDRAMYDSCIDPRDYRPQVRK
jgi:uncharacterized LabA/DUF88 family protein